MKKTITSLLVILFFCAHEKLDAQVIADGNGVAIAVAANALNFGTLTIFGFNVAPGTNKLLVVFARSSQSQTVFSITYNGQNLTRLGNPVSNGGGRIELWYLPLGTVASPVSGNIVATWSGFFQYGGLTAASYRGVDQANPMNNLASDIATIPSNLSISVSGSPGDMAVDAAAGFGQFPTPPTLTAGSGQTQEATQTTASSTQAHRISTSRASNSSGTVNMSWNTSGVEPSFPVLMQIGANIRMATALPVVLVRFSATPHSGKILLEWNSATEQNNKGFEVERSADGRSWNNLGFVPGIGTTVEVNSYSFWDEKPVAGPNHYRLKQTDLDGRFVYSPIVRVENEADGRSGLRLFPNPAPQGITSLVIPEAPEGDGFLEVFDGLGQIVLYQKLALDHGQPFPLNLSGHPAGIYTVRLEIGGNVHMERLMVGK